MVRFQLLSLMAMGLTLTWCATNPPSARADSVNSPNITMDVDTNRSAGNGAGNVAVAINTITCAETMLPEYSSGSDKAITVKARPGFQFDPTSNVSAQSATIGLNGGGINVAAVITPAGTADEVLQFNLTSGTDVNVQDIIRISGIKLKILSAAGAAGPFQATLELTTSAAGGAFTGQGIVAASITKGAPDRLVFSIQPGSVQFSNNLLPAVKIVDFGGNLITDDPRQVTLELEDNPTTTTLNGTTQLTTVNGLAAWTDTEAMNITPVGTGYTLKASHDGADFLTSDTVISGPFDITAGAPNHMGVTLQPVDTDAGSPILVEVSVFDVGDHLVTTTPVDITLDAASNPGGWPLLVDTSLTKTTDNGVASWVVADNLRINKAVAGYKLAASGLSTPVETDAFDITPGEPDHVTIFEQPVNTPAGEDIFIAAAVKDEFENTNRETPLDITLSLSENPGNATLEVGSSLTKTSADGIARWDAADELHINVAAKDYRIVASGVGASSESDAFNIEVGTLDHLAFALQPVDTPAGDDLLVTVEARDAFENLVAVSDVAVKLGLGVNQVGATLDVGTSLTKNTVEGVAKWDADDDLRIGTVATGFRLSAASDVTDTAESDSFAITTAPGADLCGTDCGTGSMMALVPLLMAKAIRARRRGRHARRSAARAL